MPEDRLYFKQRNKAEKLSAERISRMFFVSSLNSASSSHVQHNTYAFSLHIQFASFLKKRSPKTCFYRCFLSRVLAQSIYAGLGHTQAHTHIYIYIYIYICLCMYIYIYIYIYIYCIYVYIYIHTYSGYGKYSVNFSLFVILQPFIFFLINVHTAPHIDRKTQNC